MVDAAVLFGVMLVTPATSVSSLGLVLWVRLYPGQHAHGF